MNRADNPKRFVLLVFAATLVAGCAGLAPPVPENIETAWIEPRSGLRADRDCAGAVELPFIRGSAPEELAPCAASTGSRIKNWFRRLIE